MNDRFIQPAENSAQPITSLRTLKTIRLGLTGLVLATGLVLPAHANAASLGPLIELSRPNAVGTCDDGFTLPGTFTLDDALEPFIAVNPVNPRNVVTAWIQGVFQNIIAAVSFDGGRTWQQVPVPFSVCSGGLFLGTGDPWLSFAPNGDLYLIALMGQTLDTRMLGVCKSTDGGLQWSGPIPIPGSWDPIPDHPSLTADATDARFVYAIWDSEAGGGRGPSAFSRSTDGGLTWEPARTLVPVDSHHAIQFSQILVLPNGTLVNLYEQYYSTQNKKPLTQTNLRLVRSTDRGQTWSAPQVAVEMTPLYLPWGNTFVVDPETGQIVGDVTNPSFAVDRRNGNLYAVWEDGRFSNFQYNDVAFSMSADGGLSWSNPIRVNQTPVNISAANRQSFFPIIAVAEDGTIGVTHYDFRFNDPSPGLPTDYWLVRCHPSATKPATNPANWGEEVRLTDSSFDMEACGTMLGEFRPGDYFGLATDGNDFLSAFTLVDQDNVTASAFRRVRQ